MTDAIRARIQHLEGQLNDHIARRVQLRQALKQTSVVIERMEGALQFARELVAAAESQQQTQPAADHLNGPDASPLAPSEPAAE